MRKVVLVVMFCFALFTSSVNTVSHSIGNNTANPIVSEARELVRVYGVDYSEAVFHQIAKISFRNYIIALTENGSRWIQSPSVMSDANRASQVWISEELTRVSSGRIEVEVLGEYSSVLGRLPGYIPFNAPAILIGGHMDSVLAAPGANDDGTGIATVLELARVLSQYNWPLDIYFGAWNAEEIGLIGSREVAQIMSEREIEILVHYNIDMLLVPNPSRLSVLMAYPVGAYQDGGYWADLPKAMSSNYGSDRIEPVESSDFTGWQSSDHWSFIQKGYHRSLFAHESGFAYDSAYHTDQDVWYNPSYDYDVAIECVKAIGASIAFTMQRAYQKLIQQSFTFYLPPESHRNFSIPISGNSILNITSRWYSGVLTFNLYGPLGELVNHVATNSASPWEFSVIMEDTVNTLGVYTLMVINDGDTTTGCDLVYEFDSDIDRNDIPDSQEFWFDVSYFHIDTDSDSLSDAEEIIMGTSWSNADSDFDLMPDGFELEFGLNPLDPSDAEGDLDGDLLSNLDEYLHGCNPLLVDSDSDQMPDNYEVEHGLDPTFDDAMEDADNDLVSNLDEYLQGSNPQFAELRLERLFLPIVSVLGLSVFIATGVLYKIQKR